MAFEFTNVNAGVHSELAERKSKSRVKLNFGLSPDFSVQLKVSLSERLIQKLKWPIAMQFVDHYRNV